MTDPEQPLPPVRVLFVCTGNICRSPTAEGVFRELVRHENLHGRVFADSAGTHGYHVGEAPDRRSQSAAARRGYDLTSLRARQITASDLVEFDYLLAMDRGHLASINATAPTRSRSHVSLLMDFSRHHQGEDVPDPYYGGSRGFEHVLDLIEAGTAGLLAEIKKKLGV